MRYRRDRARVAESDRSRSGPSADRCLLMHYCGGVFNSRWECRADRGARSFSQRAIIISLVPALRGCNRRKTFLLLNAIHFSAAFRDFSSHHRHGRRFSFFLLFWVWRRRLSAPCSPESRCPAAPPGSAAILPDLRCVPRGRESPGSRRVPLLIAPCAPFRAPRPGAQGGAGPPLSAFIIRAFEKKKEIIQLF